MEENTKKNEQAKVVKKSGNFKSNFKEFRKTQRVISLSPVISTKLDKHCLDTGFRPSEAINFILMEHFARSAANTQ